MKLSVCLDAVFSKRDTIESMRAVKAAGLEAFEFWGWKNKDIKAIAEEKEKLGLEIVALSFKTSGIVDNTKHEEYLEALGETLETAKMLNCSTIISQVGMEMPDVSRDIQHRNLVQGLRKCAPMLEKAGITLAFEPLNTLVNHKGYYLWSSDEAFEIESEVNSQNVKVLFDIYHQQIMEGNLISRIQKNVDRIRHFHAAGNPGRHELSIGEINYNEVFKAIQEAGYKGYIGLEYFPVGDPADGLKEFIKGGKFNV